MQEQAEKKNNKSSSYVLLLGIAVVVVASIGYHFWPKVKGLWTTAEAAVGLNNDVSLTAISYGEDNAIAIVDGEIVREGDMVGGIRVLKIHKDKVEFEKSGRKWSQSMPAGEEGISSGLPVMLQLGSQGCPPCRQMTPILDELKAEYEGKFLIKYIDVWKNTAAGAEYGVKKIPTQIFYNSQGRELFRHVGFYSKKDILSTWKKVGVKF
ncbi:MAG: thioredoxin family protein [Planctomycetota bacterium]|jgi:thioredoxin 1